MREDREKVRPGVTVGFISLLMIFMALCLTVFVSLALTNAAADRGLTNRTGETATSYYAAQNQFQAFLSDLDARLVTMTTQGLDQGNADFEAQLRDSLRPLMQEGVTYDEDRHVINAQWPAGERLLFKTEILITSSGFIDTGPRYTVTSVMLSPVQESFYTPMDNMWNGEDFSYDNQ